MVTSLTRSLLVVVASCLVLACQPSRGSKPIALNEQYTAMAYDTARNVVVRFGSSGGRAAETWEWDGSTWQLRSTDGPAAREGHTMAFDSVRNVTVLYGGILGPGEYSAETWEWDGTTWTLAEEGPMLRRFGAPAVFDSDLGTTVLFGGHAILGNGEPSDRKRETWEWNGTFWQFRPTAGALTARSRHAMAFDSARDVTVLFGGFAGGWDGETWERSGMNWTQRNVTGPSPRFFHAMAFDSARNRTVLFGGFDGDPGREFDGETWEWDGTSWDLVAYNGPSPRVAHSMAFDSTRNVTVLYGGFDGAYRDDTWEWNGTVWTRAAARTATSRTGEVEHFRGYRYLDLPDAQGVLQEMQLTRTPTGEQLTVRNRIVDAE